VDALLFYRLQNVTCPFLDNASCSIYPARPFACASHFATTPPQCCSPFDLRTPKIYKGSFAEELDDLPPGDALVEDSGLTLMPVKVYSILQAENIFINK
jgi:Fe-S-cluster containining protein